MQHLKFKDFFFFDKLNLSVYNLFQIMCGYIRREGYIPKK